MHPVAMAAHLHQKLVNIHPFVDGNGRTARLVMNLHLLRCGYPVTILSPEPRNRATYYDILEGEQHSADSQPFQRFIAEAVKHWCFQYLEHLFEDVSEKGRDRGYYFFKTIAPLLES